MDQKLLNALNNIGLALEELVDAIKTKSESSSATGAAIQSGNFSEDLKSISEGIKSIKADTQTIIQNQQTIMAQGKEKESAKTKDLETDPKKESDIKKGVGTILLIAVAVLAIGMAFKLVGDVNILSVIGLALGITLVAIAFEKVAKLKLGLEESAIAAGVMVIMSVGLMISSHILALVQQVAPMKMLTAIFIAAGFAVLGPSISKLVKAFKGTSMTELLKTVIFLPLILPAISLGIALASYALELVKPIGLSQFISSILISGIFVVLAFGLKKMMGAFKGIDPKTAAIAAASVPVMMIALSAAILGSSELLQNVKSISFGQFFSSLFISVVFVALSFSISKILKSLRKIDPATVAFAAASIPILMIAMSAAILGSSELLDKVVPISFDKFLTSLFISVVFIGLAFASSLIIKQMKDIDPKTLATAVIGIPLLMVAMSAAIFLASVILDKMTVVSEEKLINAGLIGAGLAILSIAMAPSIKVLGKLSIGDVIKGALIIPILAAAIMISSLILSLGKYDGDFPTTDWIKGVSLSLLVFGAATIGLGFLITASGGLGLLALAAGAVGVLIVGAAIAATSHVLKLGDYKTSYPGLDWAKGVSLSLVAFGSGMVLLGGIIFASFGIGLAMLKAGSNAVLMVAKTIVGASDILANGYTDEDGKLMKPNYKGGPTKEWAEGVGLAIGAFAPVFGVLTNQSWFGKSVKTEDMSKAIMTISEGIVAAAEFFANNTAPFEEGMYPSKNWGEGVGAALGSFAPVFDMLMEKSGFWKSGDSVINDMIKGIVGVSTAIVSVAKKFSLSSNDKIFENYPDKTWSESIKSTIEKFVDLSNYLDKNKGVQYWRATSVASRITKVAKILHGGAEFFSNPIDPNYIESVSKNMLDFNELVKKLTESESEGMLSRLGNNLLGTDPIMQIAKGMITLADGYDKLAESLIKLGGAMRVLNISDIRMLGGLTPSLSKPTESGGGGLIDSAKGLFDFKKAETGSTVGAVTQGSGGEESSLKEDMAKIVKLLSNIDKSTETSSISLSDMLVQLRDDGVKTVSAGN